MSEYITKDQVYAILHADDELILFARKHGEDQSIGERLCNAITRIPDADVEPVVRGECEHCSSKIQTANDGQPFSQEFYLTTNGCKFCPQCGRKLHMERSGSGE